VQLRKPLTIGLVNRQNLIGRRQGRREQNRAMRDDDYSEQQIAESLERKHRWLHFGVRVGC
jgi:hypothetical protein